MNRTAQFLCQHLVDHAVTLDQGLALERFSLDLDPKMCFTFRPRTGVTGMKMSFVDHLQRVRHQRF